MLAFYLPLWHRLLNLAKAHRRLHIAVINGFPKLEDAIDGECHEILCKVIIYYEGKKWEVKKGYYPEHKQDTCRLLFNYIQTFYSDIKKVVLKFMHTGYNLVLPSTATMTEQCFTAIKEKAAVLLSTSAYLCGDPDSLGKMSNFAHTVLHEVTLDFFYNNSSPNVFSNFLNSKTTCHPKLCYLANGFVDEKSSKLNSESIQTAYNELTDKMDAVLNHDYHGAKIEKMLKEWARSGFYAQKPKATGSTCQEFTIVLY
ncbi:hypothetical protein JVT61DRAFT_10865 [Boletus reticuloceps]|uniref:DUF6532 domain-containing protein n=1 Tax=Boletus reticuloceps TaxID=495285 RepID=A0A8I3A592_9AGAM|nr:hypothetical protein JVT61DRAFT_10865 [Boletus reticuloceps]